MLVISIKLGLQLIISIVEVVNKRGHHGWSASLPQRAGVAGRESGAVDPGGQAERTAREGVAGNPAGGLGVRSFGGRPRGVESEDRVTITVIIIIITITIIIKKKTTIIITIITIMKGRQMSERPAAAGAPTASLASPAARRGAPRTRPAGGLRDRGRVRRIIKFELSYSIV